MKSSSKSYICLWKLVLPAALAATLLSLTASADRVLFSDNFVGAEHQTSLMDYKLTGQQGELAPLEYVMVANTIGSLPIATLHNPDHWNVVLRTLRPDGDFAGALAFGLSRELVNYNSLIIEFAMRRNNAVWSSVVMGNDTPASQAGADLFTLRLLNNGAVQVKPSGSGPKDPTINFRDYTANGNESFTAFRIEVETAAWDGRGQATIRAFYNVQPADETMWQQLDLGGPNGSLVRPAFRNNYITFSSQHPDRNSTAFYRNIRIRTKDRK
jgi:hypothetical protein